ncbi:MAG: carboxymuconolactone decarboxylase family protein [Lentimicrobiaceae bacterium]|jgi:4-carboxymuconolactone decarboxylase
MDTKLSERYQSLLGFVPENIKRRLALAELTGQEESIEAVEHMREILIHNNPLGAKIQQVVHFAMLVAIGEVEPARLHVRGALKAGATPGDLYGVCETAAIVGGMPAFSLAVDIVYEALDENGLIVQNPKSKK